MGIMKLIRPWFFLFCLLSTCAVQSQGTQTYSDGEVSFWKALIGRDYSVLDKMVKVGGIPIGKEVPEVLLKDNESQFDQTSKLPLHFAVKNRDAKLLLWLIKQKFDINEQNANGETALALAAWMGETEIVRLLLNLEADSNIVDKYKGGPLYWAVSGKYSEIVKLLLDHKAQVESDALGLNPLLKAFALKRDDLIALLAKHIKDPLTFKVTLLENLFEWATANKKEGILFEWRKRGIGGSEVDRIVYDQMKQDSQVASEVESCFLHTSVDPTLSISSWNQLYQLKPGLKKINNIPDHLSSDLTEEQIRNIRWVIEDYRKKNPTNKFDFIFESNNKSVIPVQIEFFDNNEIYLNFPHQFKNGGFKKIRKSINYDTGEVMALLESESEVSKPSTKVAIENEKLLFKQLAEIRGFPKVRRTMEKALAQDQVQLRMWLPMYFADLSDFIYKKIPLLDFKKLTVKQKMEMTLVLLKALRSIHLEGFLHRDLKPSNVLVGIKDKELTLDLNDFGISVAKTNLTQRKKLYHTHGFLAPRLSYRLNGGSASELLFEEGDDLWSMGMLLYELKHRKKPFWYREKDDVAYKDQVKKLMEVEGYYELDPNLSLARPDILDQVIKGLLQPQHDKRMNLQQAIETLETALESHGGDTVARVSPAENDPLKEGEEVFLRKLKVVVKIKKNYDDQHLQVTYEDNHGQTQLLTVGPSEYVPPLWSKSCWRVDANKFTKGDRIYIGKNKQWGKIEKFFGLKFARVKLLDDSEQVLPFDSSWQPTVATITDGPDDNPKIYKEGEKFYCVQESGICYIEKIVDKETILVKKTTLVGGTSLWTVPLSNLKKQRPLSKSESLKFNEESYFLGSKIFEPTKKEEGVITGFFEGDYVEFSVKKADGTIRGYKTGHLSRLPLVKGGNSK